MCYWIFLFAMHNESWKVNDNISCFFNSMILLDHEHIITSFMLKRLSYKRSRVLQNKQHNYMLKILQLYGQRILTIILPCQIM